MKLKISKSQWQEIGKKTGWITAGNGAGMEAFFPLEKQEQAKELFDLKRIAEEKGYKNQVKFIFLADKGKNDMDGTIKKLKSLIETGSF